MARSGSPVRHGMIRPSSPVRQMGAPYSPRSMVTQHHGMARSGSPVRQMQTMGTSGYFTQQQGMARTASPLRQHTLGASATNNGGIPYNDGEDQRQPSASLYSEPPRSSSRLSNRPPTVRDMQDHFQQYSSRGDREDIWRTRNRTETFTFDHVDGDVVCDLHWFPNFLYLGFLGLCIRDLGCELQADNAAVHVEHKLNHVE